MREIIALVAFTLALASASAFANRSTVVPIDENLREEYKQMVLSGATFGYICSLRDISIQQCQAELRLVLDKSKLIR